MADNIAKMKQCDIHDEDGYREWTRLAQQLGKELHHELAFTGTLLYQILQNTPVSNPRNGPLAVGDDSKAYARKVRGHLSRAAQSVEYATGQVIGAWKVTEQGFLVPSTANNRGMKKNSA